MPARKTPKPDRVSRRVERGMAKGRQMLGQRWDEIFRGLEAVDPDLARYTLEWAYGEVFNREVLEPKTRELLAVASLTVLRLAPQLKTHLHAALNVGATEEEIREVLLQLALYHGFPTALFGATVAQEVFGKRRKAVAPRSSARRSRRTPA